MTQLTPKLAQQAPCGMGKEMVSSVSLPFGHGSGICDLDIAETSEGWRLVSGGADGKVELWDPTTSPAPSLIGTLELDSEVTAVGMAPSGQQVAIGSDNFIKSYSLPEFEFQASLTRFTAKVRGIAYSPDGKFLAACSNEPGIIVIRVSSPEKDVLTLKGHDGGVKSVAWSPSGECLVSSGFDGKVVVHQVSSDLDPLFCESILTEDCLEKEVPSDECKQPGKAAWHPNSTSLAFPGDKAVLLRPLNSTSNDTPQYMLCPGESGHCDIISCLAYTADGKHLASGAVDGRVVVWDAASREPIQSFQLDKMEAAVCNLAWVPATGGGRRSVLIVQSTLGGFAVIRGALPGSGSAGASASAVSAPASSSASKGQAAATAAKKKAGAAVETEDVSVESIRHELMNDEAGEASDLEVLGAGDGAVSDGETVPGVDAPDVDEDFELPAMLGSPAARMQPHFQPGSTPAGGEVNRRFLCWNQVGSIVSIDEGTNNTVEVMLADISAGKAKRFSDTWNFSMGTLGQDGALLATTKEGSKAYEDDDNRDSGRSVLYYLSMGRRTAGLSWSKMLLTGEGAQVVAAGCGWAAVATTKQIVRVFTSSGLQSELFSIPGPVVTMCGSGSLLAVVYHGGPPTGTSQTLHYILLDVHETSELASGALSLSPGSTLAWAGFAADLMLVTVDSEGMLRGLSRSLGWRWTPLLDAKDACKNREGQYWPVAVMEDSLVAVALKGGEDHPSTLPRPVCSRVKLASLPLGHKEGGHGLAHYDKLYFPSLARVRQQKFCLQQGLPLKLEQEEEHSDLEAQQLALDRMLLKLLQDACANTAKTRALDLAKRLSLEKSFMVAIKVANHHSMVELAAEVEAIMTDRFTEEDTQDLLEEYAGANIAEHEREESDEEVADMAVDSPAPTHHKDRDSAMDENVTNSGEESGDEESSSAPKVPVNPFARSRAQSPPKKRKDAFDMLAEMEESPSPAGKKRSKLLKSKGKKKDLSQPVLGRDASFTQHARGE
ncbi:unnamed protein product [Chrysoparadoxa australica]